MPPRRSQPRDQAEQPPRRSERLRQQRETSAPTAIMATATTAPTNLSTVAAASRAINAHGGRRRGRGRQGARALIRQSSTAPEPMNALNLMRVVLRGLGSRSPPLSLPRGEDSTEAGTIRSSTPNPESENNADMFELVPFVRRVVPPSARNMGRVAIRRLQREMKEFEDEPPDGCSYEISDDNFYHWKAMITGPSDTPYEGGQFYLDLMFPPNYPFSPPRVYFITKIYHCNIAETGYVCLDILSRQWSPALTVTKVLLSIISLLSDPNPDDPLEPNIARLYKRDRQEHDITARSWTAQYAKPKDSAPAVVN